MVKKNKKFEILDKLQINRNKPDHTYIFDLFEEQNINLTSGDYILFTYIVDSSEVLTKIYQSFMKQLVRLEVLLDPFNKKNDSYAYELSLNRDNDIHKYLMLKQTAPIELKEMAENFLEPFYD